MIRKNVVVLLAFLFASLSANGATLGERLKKMERADDRPIPFVEERHSAVLAEPVIQRGYLRVDPESGDMIKQIETPEPLRMTINNKLIVIEQDDRKRRIGLAKRPELQALLQSVKSLMAGSAEEIERYFSLDYSEDAAADTWRLVMHPKHERLARKVDALIVDGDAGGIREICTRMDNGDWQHMSLVAAHANAE